MFTGIIEAIGTIRALT
ncbi:MAG TPA: hypothetical protein DEO97_02745, partial [Pseudomonas sp.]|nr:hypothetical protein [Pseudomonas sp.]